MRTLSPDIVAAFESGAVHIIVLVEIVTPTLTVRMTSDTYDNEFNGETFVTGTLGSISAVDESGDISSTGISITFSGVDPTTLAVAASNGFLNSPVKIWLHISSDVSETEGAMLFFDGFTTGAPSISYGNSSSVAVSCQGKFAALDRPRSERYADAEQQKKYPGDLGMQYASTVANKVVIWPAAKWFKNNG